MDWMKEIYSDIVLRYAKDDSYRGKVEGAIVAEDKNESCGDEVKLYLKVKGNEVEDASFEGVGCIVSMASAAMLVKSVRGKSVSEVEKILENVEKMMKGEEFDEELLGDLVVFSGISGIPARSKCFYLAWSVLKNVLKSLRRDES